jgi:hypothetical protein
MASSVALVNKDIARHYQLANLLAPPEAIELTKLYNEMSDILSKPVKFRNQPMQFHLFYYLLSQYGKHFNNVTLEGIKKPPPTKPHEKMEEKKEDKTEEKKEETNDPKPSSNRPMPPLEEEEDDNMSSFMDSADMTAVPASSTPVSRALAVGYTPISQKHQKPSDLLKQAATKTPKSVTLHTPKTQILKWLDLDTQSSETPKKVLSLLMKSDDTFQYNEDNNTFIIQGQVITKNHFLQLLENLRNPAYKPRAGHDELIFHKLTEAIQDENQRSQKHLITQLPGLQKYITQKPSGTRAATSATSVPAQRKIQMDDTALTSTAPQLPKKSAAGAQTKGKGTPRKKACAVVHWNRWQKHITK